MSYQGPHGCQGDDCPCMTIPPESLTWRPDPLLPAGYQAPRCTCGHAVGDHKSNRTVFPHPLKFGVCLIAGCECREFVDANGVDRAAA